MKMDEKSIPWGLIVGSVALIVAIVAIVLVFVIPGPAGPEGPQGKDGSKGNAGTSGMAITNSGVANVYSTNGYNYTMSSPYNYTNVVVPSVPSGNPVYFSIPANKVSIGDVFVIDNTRNPTSRLFIQFSGFDNNINPNGWNEISVNNDSGGLINMCYVQITAGKSNSTKNIILIPN